MKAALPHIDIFASAHNLNSLRTLVSQLSRIQSGQLRVMDIGTPHLASRLPMARGEQVKSIPVGILKLNLEKAQTIKNEGMTAFGLRREGGQWQSYHSDQDNKVVMELPVGAYYLKVAGVIRKTFVLVAGTQINLSVE